MHTKLILAFIVISFCLSTFNTIMQGMTKRQQRKQSARLAELDTQYQLLQAETSEYKKRLNAYQAQLMQAQVVIDSLDHKQAQLRNEIKNRDKQYQNIKHLLSAPNTNFSDSTKAQILNNLPQ